MVKSAVSRVWMWFGWRRLFRPRAAPSRSATLVLPKKRPGFVNATRLPADIDDSTIVLPDGVNEDDDTVVLAPS